MEVNKFKKIKELYKELELMKVTGVIEHPIVKNSLKLCLLDQDLEFYRKIHSDNYFQVLAYQKLLNDELNLKLNPFYPFPKGDEFEGEISFGLINKYGETFRLPSFHLPYHTLITGQTGTGKSSLSFYLINFLINNPFLRVMIFDRKREYRNLLKYFPDKVFLIRSKDLKLNFLEVPPWENVKDYLAIFSKVFCSENYLLNFSENILIRELYQLYKPYEVLDSHSSNNFPRLSDLLRRLEKKKPSSMREAEAISSIINRLNGYISLGFANYKKGFNLEKLFDHNVIIEIDSFTPEQARFIIAYLLINLFRLRLKKNFRHNNIERIIVVLIDEARILFPYSTWTSLGYSNSTFIDLYSLFREFGVAFIILTQEPTSLHPSILANSGTQIMFPLSSGMEILKMAESMMLNKEQLEFYKKLPAQRVAVVKTIFYPRPFLLLVPKIEISKDIADSELDQNESVREFIKSLGAIEAQENNSVIKQEKLSPEANYLLVYLYKNPFKSIKVLYSEAGFSVYLGNKLKKELLEKGFIKEEILNLGKHRPRIYLSLTDKAYKYLGKKSPIKGKGGFIHNLIVHYIRLYFESKGWSTEAEKDSIDVVALKGNEKIAIEVTIHISNLTSNVVRNLKKGYKKILLVFLNENELKKGKEKLKLELGKSHLDIEAKIDYETAEKFLAHFSSLKQNKVNSNE